MQRENSSKILNAILENNFQSVIQAIEEGETIDFRDRGGYSLLSNAIFEDRFDIFQLLIAKGANPNLQDNKGFSPLHHCIYHKRLNFAQTLLDNNADVEIKNKIGQTPLYIAVFESGGSYYEFVDLYVKAGANPFVEDQYGNSPYSFAKRTNDEYCIKLFEK